MQYSLLQQYIKYKADDDDSLCVEGSQTIYYFVDLIEWRRMRPVNRGVR